MTADLACEVAPQRSRVLPLAVGIAEKGDLLDAQRARGIALLLSADGGEPRRRHGAVTRSLVAVGHDDEGDLLALFYELRNRAARAELAVVGVGGDHQHESDRLGHALRRSRRECVFEIPPFSIPIHTPPRPIIPPASG